MQNLLSHFKFAQFQFILKAQDCLYLPAYKGSTLRGGFGHAFKKVVCVRREKICDSCLLKGKCVYSYVFETPPPPDTDLMKKGLRHLGRAGRYRLNDPSLKRMT